MSKPVSVHPLITKEDYKKSLDRIKVLMGMENKTKEDYYELDVIGTLVDKYESDHFPIDPPDPIEAIKFRMDQLGLTQSALANLIGSKQRVSEYLNRKIPLSIHAIRILHSQLDIRGDVLIKEYTTESSTNSKSRLARRTVKSR
ncbi:helix-turn-helix domain-containing protein [Leptospira bouyouniensis]|uniref:Helix-turn-helix domain-containing protein n=1 Tax=Leptospira bouyouniensis TaxID=2484911 RepID=A0ABY2L2N9_9LEPT|nr:helix-turn-helix domain-containing protein [Leptospira bouyouniensis]TGK45534.1 helix-turn-helix domain-containing protein [Leptospira bouyouniensis]